MRLKGFTIFAVIFSVVVMGLSSVFLWIGIHRQQIDEQRDSNVFYEIFVRSFYDSDGDGVGDLNGVTEKLDYLQSLGISGIWLMPVQPSLGYHGYDVTDYYGINPEYGTMEHFERLIEEAHKRNIRIVMDLVVNHTSSGHPWFIESAQGPGSPKRDWYVWADDQANLGAASATGGQAWHKRIDGHYLGVFWSGMPDLNMDNPEVRAEMIKIGRFWLNKGVDGFRLDAAKHIYEDFQGTGKRKDIAAKNVEWWQQFRRGLDEVNKEAYLVGEVWDSTSIIGPYLDRAFNACFNFDLADQLISAAKSEKAVDFGFALSRIHGYYAQVSGGTAEDALILSNHDQDRVMSKLQGNANHAKTAASILLTLPGKPYIYYGEEIGMQGMKPDEYIREPMLWYAETEGSNGRTGQTAWEASRFNRENPPSVEAQENDPDSLLYRYKMLIRWRKLEPVLAFGAIESFAVTNDRVVAFVRHTEEDRALVLHNLSGEEQTVELDRSKVVMEALKIVLSTTTDANFADDKVTLPAYSSIVMKQDRNS